MNIVLDLAKELEVNSDNELTIKKSSESGNTLQILDDGLYAEAKQGKDGSGGPGYGKQDQDGIRIGYAGPYNYNEAERRVCVTNVIHRFFESDTEDGRQLKNFRREIDYVLPGDMYSYNGNIYLVLSVSVAGKDNVNYGPGNWVTSYVKIGVL